MYDSRKNLSHNHPALLLWQPNIPAQVVEQFALLAKLKHKEDISGTLEVLNQLDDVWVAAN